MALVLGDVDLLDAGLGVGHQTEKSFVVLHGFILSSDTIGV
jgi:hypothetical protein